VAARRVATLRNAMPKSNALLVPFVCVRIRRLVGSESSYDGWRANQRPPRIGDLGAVLDVLRAEGLPDRYVVESCLPDGSTVWLADFLAEELELASVRTPPRWITLSSVPATPWRNGKGVTRELIAWPDAQDWRLRFSIADIENDGPFSAWPDVTREFCVLDGAGVVLRWADGRKVRLVPGTAPLRFDGGDPPWAQLIEGSTRDLNLMTRGGVDASLEANDGHPRSRPWGCFAAEAGRIEVDGEALDVAAMTLVWFDDAPTSATFDHRGWWIARSAQAPR
jgi:uncharacterized protein